MLDLLKQKLASFSNQLKQTIAPKPAESEPTPIESIEQKRSLKTKTSITQKIAATVTGEQKITGSQLAPLLDELELALLEADVEQHTAQTIIEHLRRQLENKTVSAKTGIDSFIKQSIQQTLHEILSIPSIDLLQQTQHQKPLVILLLGPNGAGKTTTIAKLSHYFSKNNKTAVLCASDTFRAASIEQLQTHADRLNLRVIKHQYGADPAAVAFDAIASAKAHNTDVVLIDSAGRQETNHNLLKELEKLVRIAKPHCKIMVAESYAGQALLLQAREFNAKLGLDGFILTKMDLDPKGGTILSLCHETKKPILFIGTGQEYDDLKPFNADELIEKIV